MFAECDLALVWGRLRWRLRCSSPQPETTKPQPQTPIRHGNERPRDKSDHGERLLLDVEISVEPLKADIEAPGGAQEKAGPRAEEEPNCAKEGRLG